MTTLYICGAADDRVARETGGDEVLFFEQTSPSMRGIKFATIFRIAKLFREHTFDIVVAHRYKPIYFAGVMSHFFPIKILLAVAHEHDVFRRPTRSLFITFWCRNIICIGVSDSVSRNIEKYCGPLASRGRLFTLPHAVDLEDANRIMASGSARAGLGIPGDVFCFGTVGRLVVKKDHEVLLGAFALAARTVDAVLVIIGGGPREFHLKDLARSFGIEDKVIFTGHVDDAFRYLDALDVFVLPSGTMEAFGMVLLEAMLARLPVISSNAPGPAEVVGDCAVTFEAGDETALAVCIDRVYRMDDAEREALASGGFERLNRHYTLASFEARVWDIPPLAALGLGEEGL